MGAVYGAGFYSTFEKYPNSSYAIVTQIPTGPENVDEILKATQDEMDLLMKDGPTEEDLNKVKAAVLEKRKENMSTNNYWISKIKQISLNEGTVENFINFETMLNKISKKDIQKAAERFFKGANKYTAILNPEEASESK